MKRLPIRPLVSFLDTACAGNPTDPSDGVKRSVHNLIGALLLIAFGSGCGPSYTSATGPSPAPTPSPSASAPHASITIEDPSVTVRATTLPDKVPVQLRFLLRETSGKSSATIDKMLVGDGQGGGDWYDGVCTQGLRVPAGGVLDTFYTDGALKRLGYCAPYGGTINADFQPSHRCDRVLLG